MGLDWRSRYRGYLHSGLYLKKVGFTLFDAKAERFVQLFFIPGKWRS